MFTVRSFLVAISFMTVTNAGAPFKPTSHGQLKNAIDACGNSSSLEIRSIVLNSGERMPALGLGTWQAAPDVVGRAVSFGLNAGYKHFDCAAIYGNEKEVGASLAASTVPRETLFVTSKLWNSEHAPENVAPAVQQTLSDLQLSYLDLYLVHWPQSYAKVRGGEGRSGKNK